MPRAFALAAVLLVAVLPFPGRTPLAATQESTPADAAGGCPATGDAEHEALARRWFEEALNGHDPDVLDEILTTDFVHNTANPRNADGRAGARRLLTGLLTGFPDARYTVDAAIVDADMVVLRWSAEGTHAGDFAGFAPTGRRAGWTGINVFRVRCGLIAESWAQTDGLGRLQQLGLLPAAGAASSPVAAATGGGATPDAAAGCPVADDAANEALVRRWWDGGWNGGDPVGFDGVVADDLLHHWATGPDTAGAAALTERIGGWRAAFPDLRVTIEDPVVDGALVAARWTATCTNDGPYQGRAPTGRAVAWQGINVFRIGCGRIVEVWSEMDTIGLRERLAGPTATPAP